MQVVYVENDEEPFFTITINSPTMLKGIKLLLALAVASVFLNSMPSSTFDLKTPDTVDVKDNLYSFKYTGEVNVGNEIMPLVGQLTKDGRSMYFTSQDMKGGKMLYKMDRARVNDDFSKPVAVTGEVNNGKYDIVMPTVSGDEKTMIFVSSKDGMQNGNDLYIATKDATGKYAAIRSLDEINDPSESDSYPWLSPSGLRVYFTKQKGANITFYVADRKSANDKFSNLHELGFTLPKVTNNMSCFLTNNELEIYALSGEKIYHSTRKTVYDDFAEAQEIAKTSNDGFMSGITMTNDAHELYVFNSVGFRNTQILRFINNATAQAVPLNGAGK